MDYCKIIGDSFEEGYVLPPAYEALCIICGSRMEPAYDDRDDFIGYSCGQHGLGKYKLGDMIKPPLKA